MHFYKYHGTGNDFILIDDREETFPDTDQAYIESLCQRRFGIGADGLILLRHHPEADFRMVYFNADGRLSSFCGNGGRCVVAFAHFLGIIGEHTHFEAYDGQHEARLSASGVSLNMQDVPEVERRGDDYWLDTGSPHWVAFVEQLAAYPVTEEGRRIRQAFGGAGINVNFLEAKNNTTLQVRTYERGVEAETFSCGTGVTAAALVFGQQNKQQEVEVHTPGGILQVRFTPEAAGFTDIWLTGPSVQVFQGTLPNR